MHATIEFDQGRLISTMAFALATILRVSAWNWTKRAGRSFDDLVIAIRFERYDWAFIDEALVKAAIAGMDRFEICDDNLRRIRPQRPTCEAACPRHASSPSVSRHRVGQRREHPSPWHPQDASLLRAFFHRL